MERRIRTFLVGEAAAFLAAALVHSGVIVAGYGHREAGTAESVIALVLLLGLVVSWVRPAGTRAAGLVAQGFALLGTLVGLFTIAVGVGPRTVLGVVYHLVILAVLIWGMGVGVRSPAR